MQLDLTELSSYLPLVSCFEFGNVSGKLFPCTEGRVRTLMTSAGTPRAGAFTRAQYLDEVTWTTKSWLGLQKQRISVVLHTAIAEQIVNELACGEGGRVHGAKCLATLAGVA